MIHFKMFGFKVQKYDITCSLFLYSYLQNVVFEFLHRESEEYYATSFFSQIVQNKIWKCSANFSAFYRSPLSTVSWDQYYRSLLLNLPCKLRIQNCEMVVNVTNNVSIRDSLENCVLSCENYAELLKNYHFWNDVEMMM